MRNRAGVLAWGLASLGITGGAWAAVDADRGVLLREVTEKWRAAAQARGYDLGRWQVELEQALVGRPLDQVVAARDAKSYEAMLAGLHARPVDAPGFGETNTQLVFFPLTPCRIVDTRSATGVYAGPIAAGTQRSFNHNFDMAAQGGNPAGCSVPVDPPAIAVTITAVQPTGQGNLRAWPHTGPLPNASVVNYLGIAGLNLANTTILPVCQFCGEDFTIRADGSATQVVVDVVGYFWSPLRTPLSCATVVTNGSIPALEFLSIDSPTCPSGTTMTGGGVDSNFTASEIWLYNSSPNAARTAWTCEARSQFAGGAWPFDCYAVCCSIPGR
jgi:hypothetical protein